MPGPGSAQQSQSKSARVTVVGHASRRWRSASNAAEAERLDLALSKQRAENVLVAVEQFLRQEIPNMKIAPGICTTESVEGTQVGSYGLAAGNLSSIL